MHLEHLLSLPELIQYSDDSSNQEELEKQLASHLDTAIDQLIEMRKKEGENLVIDLKNRISTINNILNDIEKLEHQIAECEKEFSKAASDYVQLQEITEKKQKLEKQLDEKTERWIYLNEHAEKIAQSKN